MLYNGNKWILKDRDETIMNLIDDKDVILEQKLEEWIENGKEYPKIMSKFKRYIDKKDNNMRRAPKPAVAKAMLVKY